MTSVEYMRPSCYTLYSADITSSAVERYECECMSLSQELVQGVQSTATATGDTEHHH
jgi:hypothetical protein